MIYEENTLIGKISKGEYPEETIKTDYGEFKVKYPSGKDWQAIAKIKSNILGGKPQESFDPYFLDVAEKDATLITVITAYPEDFPWKNEGFIDFPDQEVKSAIYEAFSTFYKKTAKSISEEARKKSK